MSFLLDTNIVSELRKGTRSNAGVSRWFASVDQDDLQLSVLVIGELRQGIERLRRRDVAAARRIDRWLLTVVDAFADRVLAVDARVAEIWGALNVPDPLPAVDGLLAATAIAHDLTLVTRNSRHVERTGVRLINPFD